MSRVLILGGTTEAAALAEALAGHPGLEVITSLAGRTKQPRPLPGTMRTGGFGGADGLARYLSDERVDALIDATHPFADEISRHAAAASARAHVPRIVLARPEWRPAEGDRWIVVADLHRAAEIVRERFGHLRAFLAVGSGSLAPFTGLAQPPVVRVAEPMAANPLPGSTVVVDRGPFTETGDRTLLESHRIGVVVSKNAGGSAAYSKIAAARALGIPVVMVARPPLSPGAIVTTVHAAVQWLTGTLTASPASR
jgi:precorrin-6A/cobalt-precorrin-6A reductase